ncbi:MAG: GntP family permease, partial [Thermoguttaceae bacterium]
MVNPLLILGISLLVILGMILVMRINAFIALITAAFIVSLLAGGEPGPDYWTNKITRVTQEFGVMAGKIGLLIAMGAIIGKCMMLSGAADKIVFSIMRLFGAKRVPVSLFSAGFVISIPVFYDTTLYLLIPLARTFYKNVRKNYLLLIISIAAGATITHNLVPPTPGPLIAANTLGVQVGTVMFTGLLVALLLAPLTFLACIVANKCMPNPKIDEAFSFRRDEPGNESGEETRNNQANSSRHENTEDSSRSESENSSVALPSLLTSAAPIIVPVLLIAASTAWQMCDPKPQPTSFGVDPSDHFAYFLRNLVLCLG